VNISERNRTIKKASFIGIAANSLLSIIKITIGLASGSLSLLGDGIDSFFDIFTSLTGLISTHIAEKPPDINHPYGHGRAETIAAKLISFLLFSAGLQLIINTLRTIIAGTGIFIPGPFVLGAALISVFIKWLLWNYKSRIGKKYKSQILLADARNMLNDIILSLSVLIGVTAVTLTGFIMIDRILALAVGGWIIKGALEIFFETSDELMEGTGNMELYGHIFRIAESIKGIQNPHKARLRKITYYYLLDIDVEVNPDLSVRESHDLACELEKKIKGELPEIMDIVVHIEPAGSESLNENFGLAPSDL